VKHQKAWPKFFYGSDLDGTCAKPFYALGSNGRYVDLSASLFPEMTSPTRGIAVADVDGDGYPEMVYANFWSDSVYVKNQGSGNRFLGLHLMLPVGAAAAATRVHDGHPAWREGTPAIGAFVEAQTPEGGRFIRQVDGGNGHSGQRSPEVLIGLGQTAAKQIPVRITWRDFHGILHHESLSLTPGYHTVVLGTGGNA
jgi:hypothetical protein